ncbi:hypothetical protein [Mucilaginibacter sp. 21P]|uniref:hypothetical protein n=1 Tax=Mucilaginibacter sp. 21P TaxID=2778902 RepID=UPI001C58B096|nr:hypothetical protein [Mucilaginibacter sp. 21P]
MSKFMKLSRVEMKNVMGGVAQCTLTVSGPNYSNPQTIATSASNSSEANDRCVALIMDPGNGVYHCGYSCGGGNPS